MEIGLDIVEIDRIRQLARRRPGFLKRVFTADEISYCRSKKRHWQHFAVRFAAKEAVWKTIGPGKLTLKQISVRRGPDGKPGVAIKGRLAPGLKLSLSHSDSYAVAVAINSR